MVVSSAPHPLALAVLGVLSAGPLHPYGIQKRLKEWGKEDVVEIGQRATFYKLIYRLEADGLVAPQATARDARYPERTTYAITEQGSELVLGWLTDMLANHRNEYPLFPTALSFVPMLAPAQLTDALTTRADAVQHLLEDLNATVRQLKTNGLSTVTLLDDRYRAAMLTAELDWVRSILSELTTGDLDWDRDEMISTIPAEPQPT